MAASRARGRRKPPARRASAAMATLARGDRDGGADASACTVALGADDDDDDDGRGSSRAGDEDVGNAWTTRKVGARAMVGMDASRGRRTAEGVGESVAGRRERGADDADEYEDEEEEEEKEATRGVKKQRRRGVKRSSVETKARVKSPGSSEEGARRACCLRIARAPSC